jgi:hypothetical protein
VAALPVLAQEPALLPMARPQTRAEDKAVVVVVAAAQLLNRLPDSPTAQSTWAALRVNRREFGLFRTSRTWGLRTWWSERNLQLLPVGRAAAVVAVVVDAAVVAVAAVRAAAQQPVPAHLQQLPEPQRRPEPRRAAPADAAVAMPTPIQFRRYAGLPLSRGFRSNHGPQRSTITIRAIE